MTVESSMFMVERCKKFNNELPLKKVGFEDGVEGTSNLTVLRFI